jgi:hypothetical protein
VATTDAPKRDGLARGTGCGEAPDKIGRSGNLVKPVICPSVPRKRFTGGRTADYSKQNKCPPVRMNIRPPERAGVA